MCAFCFGKPYRRLWLAVIAIRASDFGGQVEVGETFRVPLMFEEAADDTGLTVQQVVVSYEYYDLV